MTGAVFLDKDGTVIEDVPYNVDPARIRLLPGAETGLKMLHAAGWRLFIVTNQSGIARGYYTEHDMAIVENHLRNVMAGFGVRLGGYYFCPHYPGGTVPGYAVRCMCRKPEPGLLVRAAQENGIDLRDSWIVGDILNDVEAGRRAGCRTVLLDNGKETEWQLARHRLPHHIVGDLREAAQIIVGLAGKRP
jgi:histidinol-phosphate phosphatase family protein